MPRISFLVCLILSLCSLCFTQPVYTNTLKDVEADISSVDDVLDWSKHHLHYQNDDLWDKAPPVDEIIKNGYGDCKMLAGVVSELLNYVGVQNWIMTIKLKKGYHMFNVYIDQSNKMHIIENAKLSPQTFDNFTEIKHYFNVKRFIGKHLTYEDFRNWFNTKIYKNRETITKPPKKPTKINLSGS